MAIETDEKVRDSYTPLMVAVFKGQSDQVRYFIGEGHDAFKLNEFGESAWTLAQKIKDPNIIKIFEAIAPGGKYDPTFFSQGATTLPAEKDIPLLKKNLHSIS